MMTDHSTLAAAPTGETALPRLSTDSLDLTALPERLDDRTLAAVKEIAAAPVPCLPSCDPTTLNQTLRMMLSALPRRHSDDISGELFVAAYQRKLGNLPKPQIDYLCDRALERCRWFPTIAECLEIVAEWRRRDEYTRRRAEAAEMAMREEMRRKADARKAKQASLTQQGVDNLCPELRAMGLKCGALVERDGKVMPA
jgi:hypothetical protein